jgi:glycine/D-amino acid oxidase-like deaminating enzyme
MACGEAGVKVVLIDKGVSGGEQSSRKWEWCRQQSREARELPIATDSLRLSEQFEAESGESTGIRRGGLLYHSNGFSCTDRVEPAGRAPVRQLWSL